MRGKQVPVSPAGICTWSSSEVGASTRLSCYFYFHSQFCPSTIAGAWELWHGKPPTASHSILGWDAGIEQSHLGLWMKQEPGPIPMFNLRTPCGLLRGSNSLWLGMLSSFCCSCWRRAGGSSRLSLRSDAMWEFSLASGFFRLRRGERCGVLLPGDSAAALRDEESSSRFPLSLPFPRLSRFPVSPVSHGALGAGSARRRWRLVQCSRNRSQPSPPLPPRGALPVSSSFSLWFSPSPGFSWAEGDADVRWAHLPVGQSKGTPGTRGVTRPLAGKRGRRRTSSPGKAEPGLAFLAGRALPDPSAATRAGSCGLSVPRPGARSRAAGVGAAEAEAPCWGCDQPLSPRAPQWPPARRGGRSGSTLPEPWRCWESQPSTCGSCGAPGATRPLPRSPTMTTGTWSRSTERRARTSGTR